MSSIDSEPENFLAYYITEKRADSALVDRLHALKAHEIRGLCHFLEVLNPSANTLRGYLNIIDELPELTARVAEGSENGGDVALEGCAGAGCPTSFVTENSFWASPAVLEILDQTGWSRKEKQKKIWELLERLRYPLKNLILSELERGVRMLIKRYGVGLSLPDELEGDDLHFSFCVRSPAELKDVSIALEKLAADREFAKLFEVLKGEESV